VPLPFALAQTPRVGEFDILNLTTMPLESGFLQGLIGDKCVLILSCNEEREYRSDASGKGKPVLYRWVWFDGTYAHI
jgi:hypothetical protein